MTTTDKRKWIALVLICATQFMVVLDVAIVNVALPSIQSALGFSQENLQWVVSAYTLTFGGFLLLGGRMADLLGRRRVFMAGLVLFSAASLACGLAQTDTFLIAARAVQGVGRGRHLAGGPLDPDDHVRRGRRAQQGARDLGRHRGHRRRGRRAAGRRPHRHRSAGSGSSSSTCRWASP